MKKILCLLLIGVCLTGCSSSDDFKDFKYTEKEGIDYVVERVKEEYPTVVELIYLGIDENKEMICFEGKYDESFSTEYKPIFILHLEYGDFFKSEANIDSYLKYHYDTFN